MCKQAKCANFILYSHELSGRVHAKVRVTIRGLLSEISLEQRTLFRCIFWYETKFHDDKRPFTNSVHEILR